MKKIFSILFIILPILIYSQSDEIKNVHLHYHNSMVVFSEIDIYIYQAKDSAEVYVKTYKSEKSYKVHQRDFLKLSNAILKINPKDVIQNVRSCLDAGNIEINFSANEILSHNMISYKVACLGPEDTNTAWKDYLNAVNLILEMAKLKLSDLN